MCFYRTSKHQVDNNSPKVAYKVMRLLSTAKVMPLHYYTNKYYSIGSTIRASKDVSTSDMDKMLFFEGEVVHAYTDRNRALACAIFTQQFINHCLVVVECKIPLGVPYWINEGSMEIAAKEMKIINIDI